MDALSRAMVNNYLRKAAEMRREAQKVDDPVVVERMLRTAERWEEHARVQNDERP